MLIMRIVATILLSISLLSNLEDILVERVHGLAITFIFAIVTIWVI